jgi:hypothetical protein
VTNRRGFSWVWMSVVIFVGVVVGVCAIIAMGGLRL